MKSRNLRLSRRNNKGTIAAILFCIILLIVIALACVAIDISHNVHVRTKLQAATDAGALGGIVEIAKDEPSGADVARAYSYARAVTGANEADDIFIKDEDPDTTVSVHSDIESAPKTLTVSACRRVNFLFPNFSLFNSVGGASSSSLVCTSSTASLSGLKAIYPYQLIGLIPSIDHVPTKGPAKGQRIADILDSNQPFELVWNPQNSKNVGWVKAWIHGNNTNLVIGESWRLQNGVVNSELSKVNVGDVIGIPLTSGGVPMNNDRPILGAVTIEVLSKGNKSMTVKIHEPVIFHGIKGTANVATSDNNQEFLEKWQPWTAHLIK